MKKIDGWKIIVAIILLLILIGIFHYSPEGAIIFTMILIYLDYSLKNK